MADDYYRYLERQHILRGENTEKVYRLGDKVTVQVLRIDMEKRQIELGLVEILEKVREERARGPRRTKAQPKRDRVSATGWAAAGPKAGRRKGRTGRRERATRRPPSRRRG